MADLTEDEELELELEQARARKAQEDATQSNAAAGVTNEETGQDPNQFVGAAKSFAKGAGRAFASIPEPSDVVTAISNIPKRLTNSASDAAQAYAPGVDPTEFHGGFAPSGQSQVEHPTPIPLNENPASLHISEHYDQSFPPDPEHPYAEYIGGVAAPAIVEALMSGGSSALTSIPGALRAGRRAVATTGGTMAGSKGGELIDKGLGGTGEFGSVIGSAIGGGIAPGIVTQAGWKGFNTKFADPNSLLRYNDAVRAGVDPSLGLVGNATARQWEDATTNWPLAGGPAMKTRLNQHGQIDTTAQAIAADLRGEPNLGNIDESTTGQKLRDAAAVADVNAKAAQNARMDPIGDLAGRNDPIDQTEQLRQMARIRAASQPHNRLAVEKETDRLNASRLDTESPLAPKVVDPGREAQLQMRINQAQRRLQGANSAENAKNAQDELDNLQAQLTEHRARSVDDPARADPAREALLQRKIDQAQSRLDSAAGNVADAKAAQDELGSLKAERNANRGQTYQEAVESRSETGRKIEGQPPLTQRQTVATKQAQTGAMKNAYVLAGGNPAEFDAANRDYGLIAGQRRKLIEPVTEEKTTGQGEAYNKFFTGTASKNADRINAFNRFAPEETKQAFADELEMKLRGSGAGGPPNPETVGKTIKSAPGWWSKTPEPARAIMGGPAEEFDQSRLAALLRTMEADASRPNRTVPGRGGNSYGAGRIFATGVTSGVPNAAAYLTGKLFTNPNWTANVVNPGAWTKGQSLARILAASTGNPGPTIYAPSPIDEEGAH